MTIGALVSELATVLRESAVREPRAEARDLVAAIMSQPRFWPTLHATAPVPRDVARQAREAATRRARGAPFAYAVGRAAFRHLVLAVDDRVLIPRQETELLVDLVLSHRGRAPGAVVADVGTGSGAIALALASEGDFDRIIATDVSAAALEVARKNAQQLHDRLRCPIEFRDGCALAPLKGERIDVLVSNPPYIAYSEAGELPDAVRDWEPATALLSAENGLALTAEIVRGAGAILRDGGLLALEVDSRRAQQVAQLVADSAGFRKVAVHRDLTGRERFILASCRPPASPVGAFSPETALLAQPA